MNLRGVRESGKAFAVPIYLFMVSVIGMGIVGRRPRLRPGRCPQAESAGLDARPGAGLRVARQRRDGCSCCCAPSRPAVRP